MYEINDFFSFIGRLENSELRDVRFLEVAVMFLKTTHKKILLNLLRLVDVASCQPDITVCTAVYSEVSSLCQTPTDSEGVVAYNS